MKSLKDNEIIDFNKDSFVHRLKLQKYVFIARKYGLDTGYDYSLYIHGPYSSGLADDYYAINDFSRAKKIELDTEFTKLVKNKSKKWLELASKIIVIKDRYDQISDDKLIDLVKSAKPKATREGLEKIIRTLNKNSLFNYSIKNLDDDDQ